MIRKLAVIAVVPLVFGLAACGSGSDPGSGVASAQKGKSSTPTPSATSTLSPEDAMLKFAQCMRAHGVKVKDPKPNQPFAISSRHRPGEKNNPFDKAQKACGQYLQQGGNQGPKADPKALDQMIKYAQCMRAHGMNMPDPKPNGGGLTLMMPKGSAGKAKAAQKACQSLLPGAGKMDSSNGDSGPHLSGGPVGGLTSGGGK